jgi:hypothetical protein
MASRFVNNCRGKTRILSITFAKREQYSQKLRDIYVTISDAQKLSTLYNVEGIPLNELTQLQHPWYLSDFTIYSPNMNTQFDANKHCVPNMVKLVERWQQTEEQCYCLSWHTYTGGRS